MNRQDQIQKNLDRVERALYQQKAIPQTERLIRRDLDMEWGKVKLIHSTLEWTAQEIDHKILVPAIINGLISRDQADKLEDTDCIVQWEKDDGQIGYALAEVAILIQEKNRIRAIQCAGLFQLAAGKPTLPYVIGIKEESSEPGAKSAGAKFIHFRPKRYYDHIFPDEP